MTRSNIVFAILVLMLGGLVASFATRSRAHHAAPASSVALPKPKAPARQAKPVAGPSASAPRTATPEAPGPLLDRPLAVTALGWHLAAPGVLQNDGLAVHEKSAFSKARLDVRLAAAKSMAEIENALARGGADDKGADVAIVPLPEFVAAYENIKALDPVMFLIVGWSSGRDLLLSSLQGFDQLPAKGEITLRGEAGSSESFLAAFALDAVGVSLDRLEFSTKPAPSKQDEGEGEEQSAKLAPPVFWPLARQELSQVPKAFGGNVLLSTGEALKLIPYVAIAQRSLVERRTEALATLGRVWFEGQARVTRDPTAASRRLAKLDGGPEPLALLGQLGEVATSSIKDNALSAGVAGRGAVNLSTLFGRAWHYWRALKVLSSPPPERAPVSGQVIAQLVLADSVEAAKGSKLPLPATSSGGNNEDQPLLSIDAGRSPRQPDELVQEVGFIAGVFARSSLRLGVYTRSVYDKQLTTELAARVSERFGLEDGRLQAHQVRPTSTSSYWLEVMPVR